MSLRCCKFSNYFLTVPGGEDVCSRADSGRNSHLGADEGSVTRFTAPLVILLLDTGDVAVEREPNFLAQQKAIELSDESKHAAIKTCHSGSRPRLGGTNLSCC